MACNLSFETPPRALGSFVAGLAGFVVLLISGLYRVIFSLFRVYIGFGVLIPALNLLLAGILKTFKGVYIGQSVCDSHRV